jgi:hypothetical protein
VDQAIPAASHRVAIYSVRCFTDCVRQCGQIATASSANIVLLIAFKAEMFCRRRNSTKAKTKTMDPDFFACCQDHSQVSFALPMNAYKLASL